MLNKDMTVDQIKAALREADEQATTVGDALHAQHGDAWGACGFAWVNIYGIKGNTKLGRNLKKAGVQQDYTRAFQIWSPGYGGQNIDIKEKAAQAYADTLKKYGFDAYVGSRLD
jgi:hypothetical protein